jgi:dipeptidyl-peptidase-4
MKRAAVLFLLLISAQWGLAQAAKELSIEAIFAEGGITGRPPETFQWSPDGTKVSFVQRDDSGEHGALYYVDLASGKKAVLVTQEKLESLAPPISKIANEREKEWVQRYRVAGYQWTPDSKHLLFDSQGQLWLYSLDNGLAIQLTSAAEPSTDPKFSPDGSRLAFVRDHRLIEWNMKDNTEKLLTMEKDPNLLYGEVDWVYAEELEARSNYFWAPDGKSLVFLQTNEKAVPIYPITDWIPQHPRVEFEKYPKAGDTNPDVRLGLVNADSGKLKWFSLGQPAEREYIPRFGWIGKGLLYVELLNRAQDQLELWFVNANTGQTRKMLTENEPKAWVPVESKRDFQLLKSGDRFLWPSWRDGHMHIYLYSFSAEAPLEAEAKLERQLTKGDFDVASVEGVDEATNTFFFTANPGDPRQQQIYAGKLDGSAPMHILSQEPGTHEANFSPAAAYYIDRFSALLTPPRLSLCRADDVHASAGGPACVAIWESRGISEYGFLAPRMLELKAADGNTTLYGTLLLPANVPAGKKIPLINNPYGGPGVQEVIDGWGGWHFLFDQILVRAGFAVLHVDNRGMAGRGKAFATALERHFGQVELADQLAAIQQVLADNPQLDSQRLGWWGWSYGGYMTLYAMTHSAQFRAGVAVAPVTDWKDYDSIYTERYLGLPKDNEDGYRDSSPVNFAHDLHGRLLDVHGTSDDNVHLQNTIQMIDRLVDAGIQFDLQLYPRKTHSMSGSATRTHLFQRIQDHFEHWLLPMGN